MKRNAYEIISECIDKDTFTVEDQKGYVEVPIIKRPISLLEPEVVKGAATIVANSQAGFKPNPDPKKMKSNDKKGSAAGDPSK